jgi:hypothetical protein
METPKFDHLMRLVTTKEVLWLDERYLGKPVLGVPHGRDFDRTLNIFTTSFSSGIVQKILMLSVISETYIVVPLSLLTSMRTGLVTVYDVSPGQDGLVRVHTPPYCTTPTISYPDLPFAGYTFLRQPPTRHSDIDIFQLSSGGIYQLKARLSSEPGGDDLRINKGSFQWSDNMKELQVKTRHLNADLGSLTEREYTDIDFRSVYEGMNQLLARPVRHLRTSLECFIATPEDGECNEDDALHDIPDEMPSFSQSFDAQKNFRVLTTSILSFFLRSTC